jgi:hypothetical protein
MVARGQPLRVTARQPIQIAAGTPATLRVINASNISEFCPGLLGIVLLYFALSTPKRHPPFAGMLRITRKNAGAMMTLAQR